MDATKSENGSKELCASKGLLDQVQSLYGST